ncbi:MAG: winged helix-turn-helix transcriptional regulator [Patescibacteria group bacterium]|nr:winged helix-turn-helix transcriptional regulator [Patescibacteria group bacterium]
MKNKDAELERVLKALANRRRIAIVRYLKTRKEAVVGDVASEIKLSFKSTSHHLAILSAAGILEKEQRSLNMYYCIAADIPVPAQKIIALI